MALTKEEWVRDMYAAQQWALPALHQQAAAPAEPLPALDQEAAALAEALRAFPNPADAMPNELTGVKAARRGGLDLLAGPLTPAAVAQARVFLEQLRIAAYGAAEVVRLRLTRRKEQLVKDFGSPACAVPDDAPASDLVRLNERREKVETLLEAELTTNNLDEAAVAISELQADLSQVKQAVEDVHGDLGGVGDKRKVEELLHKFGAAPLRKLVLDLGGPKAVAALAKEFSPDEIEGLLDDFEGPGKVKGFIAQACGGDPANLRKLKSAFPSGKKMIEFAANTCGGRPQVLGQLLQTGCGGDAAKLGKALAAFKDDFAPLKNLIEGAGLAARVEDPPDSGKMRDVLPPDCLGQLLKAGGDNPDALAQLCGAFPTPGDAGSLKTLLVDGGLGAKPGMLEGVLAAGFGGGADMKAGAAKLKAFAADVAATDGYAGALKDLLGVEGGLGDQPQVFGQLLGAGCDGDPAKLKGLIEAMDVAGAASLNALVKEGGLAPRTVPSEQGPPKEVVKADCLALVFKVGCGGEPAQFNALCKAFKDEASRKNLGVLLTDGGFGARPACLGQVLAIGFDGAASGEGAAGNLQAFAADVASKPDLKKRMGALLGAKDGLGDQPEVLAHLIGTGCDKDPARVTALFTELKPKGLNGLHELVKGGVFARKTGKSAGGKDIDVVRADCLAEVLKVGCGGKPDGLNAFCEAFGAKDSPSRKNLTDLMTEGGLGAAPLTLAYLVRGSGPDNFAKVSDAYTNQASRIGLKRLVTGCGFEDRPACLGQILATGFGGAQDAAAGVQKLQTFTAQVIGDPKYQKRLKRMVAAKEGLSSQPEVFGALLGAGCDGDPDKVKGLLTGLDDVSVARLNLLMKEKVLTPRTEPADQIVKAECLAQVFKVGCSGKPEGFKGFLNGYAKPSSRDGLGKLLTEAGFGAKPDCLGQALGVGFGGAFDATAAKSAAEAGALAAGAEPALAIAAAAAAAEEAGKGSDLTKVKEKAKAAAKAKALAAGASDMAAEAAADTAAEAAAKAALPDPAAAAGRLQAFTTEVLATPEATNRIKNLLTAKDGLGDQPEIFGQLLGTGFGRDPARVKGFVQKLDDQGVTSLNALVQEGSFAAKDAVKTDTLAQVVKVGCAGQPDQFAAFCKGYTSKDSREKLGKLLTDGGLGAAPEALGHLVNGLGGRPGDFVQFSDAYTTEASRTNLKKLVTDSGFGVKPACLGKALGTGFGGAYNPTVARAAAEAGATSAAKNKATQLGAAAPANDPVAKRSAAAALGAAPAMAEAAAAAAAPVLVADVATATSKAKAAGPGVTDAFAAAAAAGAAAAVAAAAGQPVDLAAVKKAAAAAATAAALGAGADQPGAATAAKAAVEAIVDLVPSTAPPDLTEFKAAAKAAAKKGVLAKKASEAVAEATAKATAEAAARAIVGDPAKIKAAAKKKALAAGAPEDVAEMAAEAAALAAPRTAPPTEQAVQDAAKAAAKAKALAAGASEADAEAVALEAGKAAAAAVVPRSAQAAPTAAAPSPAGAAAKLQTFAADLAASGPLTTQMKNLLTAVDGVGDQPEVFAQLLGTGCGKDPAQVKTLLTALANNGGEGVTNLNALVKEGGLGVKTTKDAQGVETEVVKADCLAQVLKVGCAGKPAQFAAFCKGYTSTASREKLGKLLTDGGLGAEPLVLAHLVKGVGEKSEIFVKVSDAYTTEISRSNLKTLVTEAGFADKPACLGQALGAGFGAAHNETAARSAARQGVTAKLADPALTVSAQTAGKAPYNNEADLVPIIDKTITDTLADPAIAEAAAKAAAKALNPPPPGADPKVAAKAAALTVARATARTKAKAATALAPTDWVVPLANYPGRTQNMADAIAEEIATAAAEAAALAVKKKPEEGAASLQTFTADVLATPTLKDGVRTLMQAEGGLGDQPEVFGHLLGTGCRRDAGQAKTLLTTMVEPTASKNLTALVKDGGFAKSGTEADPVVKPQCLGELLAIGCTGEATKFKDLCNGLADGDRTKLQGMMRAGELGKEPEVTGHLYKTGCNQKAAELKLVGNQFNTEAEQQKLAGLLKGGGLAGYNPNAPTEQRPETLGEILGQGFRRDDGVLEPAKLKDLHTAFNVVPPGSPAGTPPNLDTLKATVDAFNFTGKAQGIAGKPGVRVKNLMRIHNRNVGRLKTTYFDTLDKQARRVPGQFIDQTPYTGPQRSNGASLSKEVLLANAATFELKTLGVPAQPGRPPRPVDVATADVAHTCTRHTRKHQTFGPPDLNDLRPKDTTMFADDTGAAQVKGMFEQSYPLVKDKTLTSGRPHALGGGTATKASGDDISKAWMRQLTNPWQTTNLTLPDGTPMKTGFLYAGGAHSRIDNTQFYPQADAAKTTINHADLKAIHRSLGNRAPF